MKNIKLVVFDLAGTTVKDNRDVHRVLQATMADYGIAISTDEANDVMGIPKPVAIAKLLRDKNHIDQSHNFIYQLHDDFVKRMIRFYQEDESVGEKEGVSETFHVLRFNEIHVAVDTGFDRAITDAILNRLGWVKNKLIDASVASDEVKNGRPHPDMIFKVMELTGVKDVSEVVKVGDTPSDLYEGKSAGCAMIVGVTSGAFSADQLIKEPHTHLIRQIPELLEVLELESMSFG